MAGYRRGVLAMLPAVLLANLLSVLLNWPWAIEPITERFGQAEQPQQALDGRALATGQHEGVDLRKLRHRADRQRFRSRVRERGRDDKR